ncbi:MAG: hypothetical protein LBD80_06005 [Tannerella sp.]|jgi:hypothetical protein|nr:hypothetical protein [Tannerella sp.]
MENNMNHTPAQIFLRDTFTVLKQVVFCLLACLFAISCHTEETKETNGKPAKEDVPNPVIPPNPLVDYTRWEIKDGKFYLDGEWVFLKIGKPLIDFSDESQVNRLINDLDVLREKYYNTLELNCYWHHFDTDGDGAIDKSLAPLNKLIDAIYAKGMYPCLSVETYAVGGGVIPGGFWEIYPDAYAIDDKGNRVSDTEYGTGSDVVSIFHPGYRATACAYIRNLAKGLDTRKILYFETTVEPQYMGTVHLCYGQHAKSAYQAWREANGIVDAASEMPTSFPIPESFIKNETWNKFRAQFLAGWIDGDAAAYREIAGSNAYIAVDYLDANETEQFRRDGDPVEFLSALTAPDIIQVNWTWYFPTNKPNQKAYDRVWQVIRQAGKDWAVSEHMTFNGNDYTQYPTTQLEEILENTLAQGTRFGWEFVNIMNNSSDDFCLYRDDWSPKRVIGLVDNYWGYWLQRVETIEKESRSQTYGLSLEN